jgi:hypothetical protein
VGAFGLRLNVNPPSQVLQTNGLLCHLALASHLVRGIPTAGRLRSMGIAPLHRYYPPIRHPPAFGPLPGSAGYRAYLAPVVSHRGGQGFSSCSACPCHHAIATTPPKGPSRISRVSASPSAFALRLRARPSRLLTFGATSAFTLVMAWWLATSPREVSSIGFRVLVSRHPAIQATGLRLLPRQGCLLLNTPAFAGRTTGRDSLPSSGSHRAYLCGSAIFGVSSWLAS